MLSFYCVVIHVKGVMSGDSTSKDVVLSCYVDKCDVVLLKQHCPSVQFSYLHSSGKGCGCNREYTLHLVGSN